MNTKFLKQSFVLLLFSGIFAITAITYMSLQKKQIYSGEKVFKQTNANLDNLAAITIKDSNKKINLQLKDNLWRVAEADDYYAGYNQINNLFTNFSEAYIYRRRGKVSPQEETEFGLGAEATVLQTQDKEGKILDSVIIGTPTSNGLYRFAKFPDEDDVFLITGKYNFPKKTYSWLQQPLLSIAPNEIRALKIGEQKVSRQDILLPFILKGTTKEINISRYLNLFVYVAALDAKRQTNFTPDAWKKNSYIQITTFDGLVVDITVYGGEADEYWANLKISANNLPKTYIKDYINDNAFLYNDWYFKLDKPTGTTLLNAFIVP